MIDITFITGNQDKADYLSEYLNFPLKHHKLNLDEIQSLDLREVVDHKVRQAYDILKTPVLVEDVSLEFTALGRLPGTFIKFFVEELDFQTICDMLNSFDRSAVARCMFGYFDGTKTTFIEGQLSGSIAKKPAGEHGFGWDKIFIPEGYPVTRASLDREDDHITYATIKPLAKLKQFLESL